MQLDRPAAERALTRAVGTPLNLSPTLAAFGVGEMVDENMANAARVHAIESGKDVTRRTLIAFGGAAPLHAARVAEKLGIDTFVVPPGAGVGSAVGFLRAPVAYEIVRSAYQRLDEFDLARANAVLEEMSATAREVVEPAAFGVKLEENRIAFMRYVGQGHEIAVPVPARVLGAADLAALRAAFEAEYSRLYSRVVPGMTVELLTWAVRVAATVDSHVETPQATSSGGHPPPAGERRLFDPGSGETITAPVWERIALYPGAKVPGPAVIVEDETTTIVTNLFDAEIDGFGRIVCRRRNGAG
jgi:N-methylhydantoinase A